MASERRESETPPTRNKRKNPTSATTTETMATSSETAVKQSQALGARIVSGSVGSLITALAVTPLEVVKVHLQNGTNNSAAPPPAAVPKNVSLCPRGCGTFVLNNGLFDCVLPKSSVPYFDQMGKLKCTTLDKTTAAKNQSKQVGTISMIRNIFVKEGFRGIYAGLGPTLVMGIPSTALYYTVYDELVENLRKNPTIVQSVDTFVPLMAGSSARLLSTLSTAPLELIRTRQASAVGEGKEAQGMLAELKAIVRIDGVGALYKGLTPTLWRDVPFSGIYWVFYEQFKLLYQATLVRESDPKTPLQQSGLSFMSGASSGMVAAACTTPFDVVKTRQQAVMETAESIADNEIAACNHDGHVVYRVAPTEGSAARPSVFGQMKNIYEAEGLQGLWRGNQTRMIKVAPSCAIMITCYELGKRILEPSP